MQQHSFRRCQSIHTSAGRLPAGSYKLRSAHKHGLLSASFCAHTHQECCTTTEWDGIVCTLAQQSSVQLGLTATGKVEAWPQQVTLVSDGKRYRFGSAGETAPESFGKMVVLLLPHHTVSLLSVMIHALSWKKFSALPEPSVRHVKLRCR